MEEKAIEEIIYPTDIQNLDLVPAGPIPPNPAELIETKQMRQLMQYARKNYDYVIVDTPPIALVADALSVATYSDLTLYLVRQNYSNKSVLEIANTMVFEEKLPKLYLLLNDLQPSRSLGIGYYYGYGKGYSYDYYESQYKHGPHKES